jgi:hypothetical protein
MPDAAYCRECAQNVWVGPSGACPQGHGPECLSGHYWADDIPQPLPVDQSSVPERALPGWLKALAVAVILVIVLSVGSIGYATYAAAREQAAEDSCFQNQYDIEDASVSYAREHGELPDRIGDMVPDSLPEIPVCPSGGEYRLDATLPGAECTEHGWYGDCFT